MSVPSDQKGEVDEPIAVVGMGFCLSGRIASLAELWKLLSDSRSGRGPVSESHFKMKGFHHPDPEQPGPINNNSGYFIDRNLEDFDNGFFRINNIEA
ncbi:hypothetical protein K458DRAFT_393944 [Lentithecium fluviatile CBS 122367]|uniref:Beta-ketoacyl synthase-like N-terminal domain-containing protein n=1 Tax=Lentithecium fluviatile CBS 122367 TaxID=1168545 RepID=A0A6G1ING0_9PLEO|nr:hypothetical protein K458DRAFT_393944 [Lentithecium fluviatile CBS 122367]